MSFKTLIIPGIVASIVIITAYFIPFNNQTETTNTTNMTSFNQTAMLERGNVAMGFNQSLIHHHFMATTTGGEIMILSYNNS